MKANLTAGYATVVRWEMARGKSEAEAHESALAAIYERGADEAAARRGPRLSARALALAATVATVATTAVSWQLGVEWLCAPAFALAPLALGSLAWVMMQPDEPVAP